MITNINNMFGYSLIPNSVSKFTLFRGVTDYTNLAQFDLFETGYSFLICLQIPIFLDKLEQVSSSIGGYATLIQNYRHIIEWEFRGTDGIEDITSDISQISNGITDINMITKITEQSSSTFSMNYFERSGSILTKVNELFLRGIKDSKTQIKCYNGLLETPFSKKDAYKSSIKNTNNSSTNQNIEAMQESGYQYEIFHFLLIITDNTCLNVERAYLLACCQPTTAHTSIYNVTRGEIQFQEMALQFTGIPVTGRFVTYKAVEFLKYINENTSFDEMDAGYKALDESSYGDNASGEDFIKNIEKSNSNGEEIKSTLEKDIKVSQYTNQYFNTKGYQGLNIQKDGTITKAADNYVMGNSKIASFGKQQ